MNPSVQVMSGDYAKQLDLAPQEYTAPVYKYRKFTQISGGSNLTLTTSTTLSQFNIPGDGVWNFKRSFLTFDLNLAAQGGGNLSTIFCDNVPMDRITLQTASGTIIADLQAAQIYTKTARFLCTDLQEYLSRESVRVNTTVAAGFGSVNNCCQPAHCPIAAQTTTAQTIANVVVNSQIVDTVAAGVQLPSAQPADDESGSDIDYIGPQRIGSSGANAVAVVRFKIDFDAFIGTVLGIDRDLFFGTNLQLNIYWKPVANWGYFGAVAQGATTAFAGASTLSNYYLFLANDINDDNVTYLKSRVLAGGMEMLVPYTTYSQISTGAGSGNAGNLSTIFTLSTPLTPGMGSALKRIMTVPCNLNDSLERTANTFNVAQVKWGQLQTNLDGKPIQDQYLVDANGDVWNYMYQMLKNTPAGMSNRNFHINQFFVDNFSDCDDGSQFPENDLKLSGMPITQSRTYNFSIAVTSTPGLKLAQYQTYVRKLVIMPNGLSWGN